MLKLYLWTFSYLLVLLGWVFTSFLPPVIPPLVNYGAHFVAVSILIAHVVKRKVGTSSVTNLSSEGKLFSSSSLFFHK